MLPVCPGTAGGNFSPPSLSTVYCLPVYQQVRSRQKKHQGPVTPSRKRGGGYIYIYIYVYKSFSIISYKNEKYIRQQRSQTFWNIPIRRPRSSQLLRAPKYQTYNKQGAILCQVTNFGFHFESHWLPNGVSKSYFFRRRVRSRKAS